MSPEMLMQPFEQSFTTLPMTNGYYQHNNEEEYLFGYPQQPMDGNGDFRPTFYNPFEIKHRRRTSRAQLKVLEKSFSENPKPNATVRRILAQKLDMTPRGVQIWFQNRRAKAKLQRRKSGEESEESSAQQQQQQDSPVLFNQFFNNLKAWDNSARSIATAAAASCIFDPSSSINNNNNNNLVMDDQQTSVKMEDWFKMPIHPLAPVIDQADDFDFTSTTLMSSEEWRRKSCPALGAKPLKQSSYEQSIFPLSYPMENNSYNFNPATRRMTAEDINGRLAQSYPNGSECNTPRWNTLTPPATSIDLYPGLNYSPMSQQLTPMLSTGSPVSSVDGGYYDSCIDLLIGSSSTCSS